MPEHDQVTLDSFMGISNVVHLKSLGTKSSALLSLQTTTLENDVQISTTLIVNIH